MVVCSIVCKLTLRNFEQCKSGKDIHTEAPNLLVGTIGIAVQVIQTTFCRDYTSHMLNVRRIKTHLSKPIYKIGLSFKWIISKWVIILNSRISFISNGTADREDDTSWTLYAVIAWEFSVIRGYCSGVIVELWNPVGLLGPDSWPLSVLSRRLVFMQELQFCCRFLSHVVYLVPGTPSHVYASSTVFVLLSTMHMRKRKEGLLMSVHLVNSLPLLQSWSVRANWMMLNSSDSIPPSWSLDFAT